MPERLLIVGLAVERKPARGALGRLCHDCGVALWILADDIVLLEAGAEVACRTCAFRGVLRAACCATLWRNEVFEPGLGLCTGDLPYPPSVEAAFIEASRPN
jgi:hypothetical protein